MSVENDPNKINFIRVEVPPKKKEVGTPSARPEQGKKGGFKELLRQLMGEQEQQSSKNKNRVLQGVGRPGGETTTKPLETKGHLRGEAPLSQRLEGSAQNVYNKPYSKLSLQEKVDVLSHQVPPGENNEAAKRLGKQLDEVKQLLAKEQILQQGQARLTGERAGELRRIGKNVDRQQKNPETTPFVTTPGAVEREEQDAVEIARRLRWAVFDEAVKEAAVENVAHEKIIALARTRGEKLETREDVTQFVEKYKGDIEEIEDYIDNLSDQEIEEAKQRLIQVEPEMVEQLADDVDVGERGGPRDEEPLRPPFDGLPDFSEPRLQERLTESQARYPATDIRALEGPELVHLLTDLNTDLLQAQDIYRTSGGAGDDTPYRAYVGRLNEYKRQVEHQLKEKQDATRFDRNVEGNAFTMSERERQDMQHEPLLEMMRKQHQMQKLRLSSDAGTNSQLKALEQRYELEMAYFNSEGFDKDRADLLNELPVEEKLRDNDGRILSREELKQLSYEQKAPILLDLAARDKIIFGANQWAHIGSMDPRANEKLKTLVSDESVFRSGIFCDGAVGYIDGMYTDYALRTAHDEHDQIKGVNWDQGKRDVRLQLRAEWETINPDDGGRSEGGNIGEKYFRYVNGNVYAEQKQQANALAIIQRDRTNGVRTGRLVTDFTTFNSTVLDDMQREEALDGLLDFTDNRMLILGKKSEVKAHGADPLYRMLVLGEKSVFEEGDKLLSLARWVEYNDFRNLSPTGKPEADAMILQRYGLLYAHLFEQDLRPVADKQASELWKELNSVRSLRKSESDADKTKVSNLVNKIKYYFHTFPETKFFKTDDQWEHFVFGGKSLWNKEDNQVITHELLQAQMFAYQGLMLANENGPKGRFLLDAWPFKDSIAGKIKEQLAYLGYENPEEDAKDFFAVGRLRAELGGFQALQFEHKHHGSAEDKMIEELKDVARTRAHVLMFTLFEGKDEVFDHWSHDMHHIAGHLPAREVFFQVGSAVSGINQEIFREATRITDASRVNEFRPIDFGKINLTAPNYGLNQAQYDALQRVYKGRQDATKWMTEAQLMQTMQSMHKFINKDKHAYHRLLSPLHLERLRVVPQTDDLPTLWIQNPTGFARQDLNKELAPTTLSERITMGGQSEGLGGYARFIEENGLCFNALNLKLKAMDPNPEEVLKASIEMFDNMKPVHGENRARVAYTENFVTSLAPHVGHPMLGGIWLREVFESGYKASDWSKYHFPGMKPIDRSKLKEILEHAQTARGNLKVGMSSGLMEIGESGKDKMMHFSSWGTMSAVRSFKDPYEKVFGPGTFDRFIEQLDHLYPTGATVGKFGGAAGFVAISIIALVILQGMKPPEGAGAHH